MYLILTLWVFVTLYTLFYWWRLAGVLLPILESDKNEIKQKDNKPVSVILATRNDLPQLKKNLPIMLQQDYSFVEWIIVDDDSSDGSYEWLKNFDKRDKNLKILNHKKNTPGKKAALTAGINIAQNNYILLTDADCAPATNYWINRMIGGLADNDVVLGYGPYYQEPGLLNKFCRFDTALIGIQYMARAAMRKPYMGVGRNMAYKKEVFERVNGFNSHLHLASGDDDLFIQALPLATSIGVVMDPSSFMYSISPKTWLSYMHQKSRHIKTSPNYKGRDKIWLALFPVSLLLFYVLSFYLLFFHPYWVIIVLIIRWTLYYVILKKIFNHIKEKELLFFIPLLDILYLPIYAIIFIYNRIHRNNSWK